MILGSFLSFDMSGFPNLPVCANQFVSKLSTLIPILLLQHGRNACDCEPRPGTPFDAITLIASHLLF